MNKKKGLIPELRFPEFQNDGDWTSKKLAQVGEIVTGNTPNTSETVNYGDSKLFVSPADIKSNRYIFGTKTKLSDTGFSKTRHIAANSVLFVCIGSTIGKIAQNKVECATNQQINSIIPTTEYSSDFLYSILENSAPKISELAGIQAVPIINKTQFSEITLPIPQKLEEQQKIGSCFSFLDELIAFHSERWELLKEHKKGLMQNLFPQEGENIPKHRFPGFESVEVWKEKKLGELCSMQAGKFINASEIVAQLADDLYPCYGGNGLRGYTKSYTHNGTYSLIGRQGALCGNITLADGKFHATEHAVVVTPKEWVDTIWLFYLLELLNLNQYATGQAQPGLSVSNIEQVRVRVSGSIKEQQKIASCLSAVAELISAQADKIEELKLHKKGLMQRMFPKMNE